MQNDSDQQDIHAGLPNQEKNRMEVK